MKKLYALIILLAISFNGYCQYFNFEDELGRLQTLNDSAHLQNIDHIKAIQIRIFKPENEYSATLEEYHTADAIPLEKHFKQIDLRYDNLKRQIYQAVTDSLGIISGKEENIFTYTAFGKIESMKQPDLNKVFSYRYDSLQRLVEVSYSSNGFTVGRTLYTYNDKQLAKTETESSVHPRALYQRFSFDRQNRMTKMFIYGADFKSDTGSTLVHVIKFYYDQKGRPDSMRKITLSDSTLTYKEFYTYDSTGRVKEKYWERNESGLSKEVYLFGKQGDGCEMKYYRFDADKKEWVNGFDENCIIEADSFGNPVKIYQLNTVYQTDGNVSRILKAVEIISYEYK